MSPPPAAKNAVLPSAVHTATNTVPLSVGSTAAGLRLISTTYGVVEVVNTMNCAVALPGSSVSVPVVLRYSARRTLPLPVTESPRAVALDTRTPMEGTTAPVACTVAGVGRGDSCRRLAPPGKEKALLSSKSIADTLTFTPHWAAVEGKRTDRHTSSSGRTRADERRMAEAGDGWSGVQEHK